ncbi:MAG TPA: hypothetical protein VLC97_09640, partial [Rhodanobacteraceae bacterium]|nr:hypothetical protein [Rhodanobacteraceae bacterium]
MTRPAWTFLHAQQVGEEAKAPAATGVIASRALSPALSGPGARDDDALCVIDACLPAAPQNL